MTKEERINEILNELADTSMFNHKFTWGSSQYETAAAAYQAFKSILEIRGDISSTLKAMGVTFNPDGLVTVTPEIEAVKDFVTLEIEDLEEREDPDEYDVENLEKLRSGEIITLNDLLQYCKDAAWDLWSTIPPVFSTCFKGVQLEHPESDLYDNYMIGIQCAILNHQYGTDNFEGFDT